MNNKYTKEDLDKILIEDNELQRILFPSYNPEQNNEVFEGKIYDNNIKKGKYTWKNGQIFFGTISENNKFIKKGKIKFPNNDELTGNFDEENYTITKATYTTSTRIYQGSFSKNKLDGKFIIKNKEYDENNNKIEHYIFIGSYSNGIKQGKFTLEKEYNNKTIKVYGVFDKGKKNGIFKIFELTKENNDIKENLVYSEEFFNNFNKSQLIETKKYFDYKSNNKIFCMEIFEESSNIYLLLGSTEELLIYYINIDEKTIQFVRNIFLFNRSDIYDIIKLKDNRLLLCSSNNYFKLIELSFEDKNIITSNLNTTTTIENDFKLLQEFRGEPNSKSIFCLYELSDELIASGDCENIIIWKKNLINDYIEGSKSHSNLDKEFNNFYLNPYELTILDKKKASHTYSMLKINNNSNNILLAVAQPDSKSINFFEIKMKEPYIKEIEIIYRVDSIPNRKNIMTYFKDNLIVGCKYKIIVIDVNRYELIYDIYINEFITYIDNYSNDFLLLGIMKNKDQIDYEGYLSQKILSDDPKKKGKKNIMCISDLKEYKFEGNIINSCKYNFNNKEYIITIGTDGKILVLY